MNRVNRRRFLKSSIGAAAGGFVALNSHPGLLNSVRGANDDIRAAVVGFHGHGKTHINAYVKTDGVRMVALCDADSDVLDWGVKNLKGRNQNVQAYRDVRKMIENKDIDIVSTATPNHWHALVTVWACQAGKDVCVEKPVSHNIWEGRKMVEAARKYNRVVQADLDMRSNNGLRKAVDYVQCGELGKILIVHGFCYKRRKSMGKVSGPQPIPKSIDYNLWCGPADDGPLMRKNLHYDWHWVWETGCGEVGNNGPHQLDVCRWVLGQKGLPRRVMSIGGRFGYDDDGETPNTQIAVYEYENAPIIYEVRGLPEKPDSSNMDTFNCTSSSGVNMKSGKSSPSPVTGVVVQCEGGWVDLGQRIVYDNKSREIKRFESDSIGPQPNFIKAVRSRKLEDLRTDILEGHLSTCLCHMGNISHRIGAQASPDEISDAIKRVDESGEAFNRCREHLAQNGIDLAKTKATLGPWLTMDSEKERFTNRRARQANRLLKRDYRKGFVIPEEV